MTHRIAYFLLLVGTLAWCTLILLAPLASETFPTFSHEIYKFFSPICHQDDARSLHVAGEKLGVCIRCSAIYFSFLAAVVLWPAFRRKTRTSSRAAWIVAVMPMVLDVLCDVLGIHSSTTVTRLLTGGWFGFTAAQLLVPVVLLAFIDLAHRVSHSRGTLYESQTG